MEDAPAAPLAEAEYAQLRVKHAVQSALAACGLAGSGLQIDRPPSRLSSFGSFRSAKSPSSASVRSGVSFASTALTAASETASAKEEAAALKAGEVARAFVVGASTGAVGAALLLGLRLRAPVTSEGVEPGQELDELLDQLAPSDAVFVADPAAPLGEAQLERLHASPARVLVLRAVVPGDLLQANRRSSVDFGGVERRLRSLTLRLADPELQEYQHWWVAALARRLAPSRTPPPLALVLLTLPAARRCSR